MLSISRPVAVCVAATAVVAFGVAPAVGAVLDPGDPMVAAVSSQARRAEASRVTPAPVPPPAPADAATDVVRLTNAERAARGLPALVIGPGMAQVALAWATLHPMVSTVITGASQVSQVHQNFETLDVIPLITPEVKAEIEAAIG